MLIFGEKLTAQEALKFNFVSRVYSDSNVDSVVWPKLREYSQLPPNSMQTSKKLIRSQEKTHLLKAINDEGDELNKCFRGEEFINAVIAFASRKSKL